MINISSNYEIKKQYFYIGLIFFSFYFIHYLLNGYYTLRVEDLLDNEIVYNKIIGDYYRYGREFSFDLLLNGNHNYLSLRRLYHPNTFLYFLFNPETAYIINDIIIRIFSFIFFTKFISIFFKDIKTILFSSLLFCLSLKNSVYGFDIITALYIPYLCQKRKIKFSNWFILIFAASNSDLAYNFYIPIISFLLLILVRYKKNISIKFYLKSSLVFSLFLIIFNINLFQLFLSESISNKSSMIWKQLGIYDFFYLLIKNFFQIKTYSLSDPYKFFRDIPLLFYHTIPLIFIIFIKDKMKNKFVLIYLSLLIFHLFLKTEIGYNLREMSQLTKELRITIILKYSALFTPIFFAFFYEKIKKSTFINKYLFLVFFILILSSPGPIFLMKFFNYSGLPLEEKMIAKKLFLEKEFIDLKDFLNSNKNKKEKLSYSRRSFKGYYVLNDYKYIKQIVGDKVAISLSGPKNKIDPMKAVYFNIRTIDGYYNYYPQHHKDSFLKIIKDEYKDKPQKLAYFENWGQRIYLTTHDTSNIKLNFDVLRELNVDYIITKDILKNKRLTNICNNCGNGKLNLYKII
ncbi:DUF6044 family protein [Candidatus Pelagibacter sp.]|nr:DUF6044 family protein [Candidatus Pelagibacter sp.]